MDGSHLDLLSPKCCSLFYSLFKPNCTARGQFILTRINGSSLETHENGMHTYNVQGIVAFILIAERLADERCFVQSASAKCEFVRVCVCGVAARSLLNGKWQRLSLCEWLPFSWPLLFGFKGSTLCKLVTRFGKSLNCIFRNAGDALKPKQEIDRRQRILGSGTESFSAQWFT